MRPSWPGVLLAILPVVLGSAGCSAPTAAPLPAGAEDPAWFSDISEKTGLNFQHDAGPDPNYFLPHIMGSGAALLDYDNDGRLDVYLLQNGGPRSASRNRLYHQRPDGTFTDVSAGSGLDIAGHNLGVAIGDIDNDGWPDVLVTQYGGTRLFHNRKNGTFADITTQSGIDNVLWGTSAAFFDYDRDGWLDLVIVNYVEYDPSRKCVENRGRQDYCHPSQFAGSVSKLYRNKGPAPNGPPAFQDVTFASGLGRRQGPGLGVACADFTGDGWPDILVANDSAANFLWVNQHDGTFQEQAARRGIAYDALGQTRANMGIAVADVDGDGLLDIFITHLTEESHTYWRQGPRGLFQDSTAAAGLMSPHWRSTGFGTVLADFNQDGAVDLALANGRVQRLFFHSSASPSTDPGPSEYAERSQLFVNDGTGCFRDISESSPALCGRAEVARGLACGDIDGDGAVDLLVTTVGGPARLLRNVAAHGHALLVRAIDPRLHRDAYGAEITVRAGKRRWLGLVQPASSYLCSNDPRVHVGLGEVHRVDEIEVLWPDGVREQFPGRPADQPVVLTRGSGRIINPN